MKIKFISSGHHVMIFFVKSKQIDCLCKHPWESRKWAHQKIHYWGYGKYASWVLFVDSYWFYEWCHAPVLSGILSLFNFLTFNSHFSLFTLYQAIVTLYCFIKIKKWVTVNHNIFNVQLLRFACTCIAKTRFFFNHDLNFI